MKSSKVMLIRKIALLTFQKQGVFLGALKGIFDLVNNNNIGDTMEIDQKRCHGQIKGHHIAN